MIEIYYAPPSIYGRKAMTVLMEKKLDYTIKPMSFAGKDHLKAEYLALNPNGEIPTLVDNGNLFYESTAIIEYLNEKYPSPPLMPNTPEERARVRMIDDFCDLHLFRSIVNYLIKFRKKEEILPEDRQRVADDLKRIEAYLGDKKFLAGNSFTLADCAFMPAVPSLERLGLGDLLESSAPLKRYTDELKKRPSYAAASLITL